MSAAPQRPVLRRIFPSGRPAILAGLAIVLVGTATGRPPYPYHFSFRSGDAFAFLGDEITYDGRYCQYVENFFLTRYPDRPVLFANAACRNDTTADVLERLDEDVIDRRVDYAFIMLGTFDGGLQAYSDRRFRIYQANYGELLERLKGAGIYPFLLSPPMFDQIVREQRLGDETYRFRARPMPDSYNGVMALYAAWLREEAVRRGRRFIDVWTPLNAHTSEERKINPSFSLIPDSLQPDAGGHAIMAAAILESLALERDGIGEITMDYTGGERPWNYRARGGSLTQVTGTGEEVSFVWKAKSLPWAFPDTAMLGVQLADLEARFNREVLHIIGLRSGDYRVTIAGETLPETWSHLELAKGLPLHAVPERPQLQRARKVAQANARRYETAVRPLRDHWETLKRIRVNHPADDDRYLDAVERLGPEMATLRQQARERFSALYDQAQPLARRFTVQRELTDAERARAKRESEPAPAGKPPAD